MLIISRKRNQAVRIGDVVINVCAIHGSSNVRLGVSAPADLFVERVDDGEAAARANDAALKAKPAASNGGRS